LEHSQLRGLVSQVYIENKLGCTPDHAKRAVQRALQVG